MAIHKKSKEELIDQAEWFLEYAEEWGKIDEKTRAEIEKVLCLNESERKSFIAWLSKKFWKELDISDKWEVEKILKRKHIDFDKIWEEYIKYLHEKSVDKHNDKIKQKVEILFESYKTPDDKLNEKIVNLIVENYSKEIIYKFRVFITSAVYKEAYFSGKIKSDDFLWYFLEKTKDIEDLSYLLNNLSLDEIVWIWSNKWFNISRKKVELIKLLKDEFYENGLLDIIKTRTVVDTPLGGHRYESRLDSIKNNISILKAHGYDIKKIKNVCSFLLIKDVSLYVELVDMLNNFIFNHKSDENEIFQGLEYKSKEELFCKCINFSEKEFYELLKITPDIHYEGNWWYSSYSVNMFGWDWDNQKLTEELIKKIMWFYTEDEDVRLLSIIWKCKWTQNWKKNIDCAFENWLILQKTIVSCDEYRTQSEPTNMYIAVLKLIDHDIFKSLIRGWVTRESFQEFCSWIGKSYINNLQQLIEKYPEITLEWVNTLKDLICSANPKNLEIIFEKYPEILIEDLCSLGNILESAYPSNLNIIFTHFWPINLDEIEEYSGLLSLWSLPWNLPWDLNFKEENHKWYLKYLVEICNTSYDEGKKSVMIKKIVSLTFEEADRYLKIFQIFDDSISMDVQRIKNELIDEILKSDDPQKIAKQINNIFERNNLPLTWKIFRVFELLYPKEKIKSILKPHWSPVLHQYLDEWKNIYWLIYKDLMKIAIKSGDRSLREYIKTFIWCEGILKKFESIVVEGWINEWDKSCLEWKLTEDEQEKLLYLFRKISVLYTRYYWKEINVWDWAENVKCWDVDVSDDKLVELYNEIKKWFHVKKWKSVYDVLQRLFWWLWYTTFQEVLHEMNLSKKGAHERWLNLYNNMCWWKIKFPEHAFLKWVWMDAFQKIINRWITCREYLWWWENWTAAWSDSTPFDIDWWYVDSFKEWGYGNIKLVIDTRKWNMFDTRENGIISYSENQYELFKTWVLWPDHYWIRTWIPTSEIDYIIYTWDFESIEFQSVCYEIAKNGYYIPVTDDEWNIKFTPDMYHKIRSWFSYMTYYDGFDVQGKDWRFVAKENDDTVNRETSNVELLELMAENSPSNEKYKDIAKENRELAESTIEWIKRILEEKCWIKFYSKYDDSITWAQLYDSWSTWRWTDIPTKDVDLDFTLLLDAKDYEMVGEIGKIIHEEIWTEKDGDHWVVEWWNQIKSKINNIWKSEERPNWVPLDLLILKKSQVIDYSSSDAMKEKLDYIVNNPDTWAEDLDRVRTNVIIMKKLLKAKWCYKKPEWWIAWIWVENWIIQNHWNFVEALETFERAAYWWKYEEWKRPISLEQFKKQYPIYDAWENYKDWCNDNFVYKLKDNGYWWILEIIQIYRLEWIQWIRKIIKEYEHKKADYIS